MYSRGTIMSEEERQILYTWATQDMAKKVYLIGNVRLHYILRNRKDPLIHPLVWTIKDRICEKEGLEYYDQEPSLMDFLAVIPKDGFIQKHTDRNKFELIHTRFNVFIHSPKEGMNTYYGGKLVNAENGCYVLSRSGIDEHYTDINTSDESRIALSFGYILPVAKLDELCSNPAFGVYDCYPLGGNIKMYNRGQIISEEERLILADWIINTMYSKVRSISEKRFDTTMKKDDPDIHPLVWEIKDRIIKKEHLEFYEPEQKTPRDFLGIVPKGAHIPKHRDENDRANNKIQIRFNVFIQLPNRGCYTYYGGTLVDARNGCYTLCRSGFDEHWTTVNQEDTARLSLSYGYMLTKEQINKLTSDSSIGTYRQVLN